MPCTALPSLVVMLKELVADTATRLTYVPYFTPCTPPPRSSQCSIRWQFAQSVSHLAISRKTGPSFAVEETHEALDNTPASFLGLGDIVS